MTQDMIGNWVQKAKASDADANANADAAGSSGGGIRVIRREEKASKGNMIMDIAEKIRPILLKAFQGIRDENGVLYQPAHIRGFALNMAQDILRTHEENLAKEQA
jgi:hypothetical protein